MSFIVVNNRDTFVELKLKTITISVVARRTAGPFDDSEKSIHVKNLSATGFIKIIDIEPPEIEITAEDLAQVKKELEEENAIINSEDE